MADDADSFGPPLAPRLELRRCICSRCGAETLAYVGRASIGGACGLCGSYELTPEEPGEHPIRRG